MIAIRPASSHDSDWLVRQLQDFSKFFNTKIPLYQDEAITREGLSRIMENHLLRIADKSGFGPIGFIAGLITPHIFRPSIRVLSEAFWWVEERHRHSRAGYLLFQSYIEFGKANADWILFTLEDNSPISEDALINRGFRFKEKNFLMEVV